jgi:hypothetical protein
MTLISNPRITDSFPLPALDAHGKTIFAGNEVLIVSVDSCLKELPVEDQAGLRALVGKHRTLVEFDRFGFVWFSFVEDDLNADFCLFPAEVSLVAPV